MGGATAGAPGPGTTPNDEETREMRWTLETFSMWLLKRGRRLRECSQWFRTFDFDQDDMVGVADFMQGLVAAAAARKLDPFHEGGLCVALALYRLLDLEKKQGLVDFDAILADAQISYEPPFPQQMALQAADFKYFRSELSARLQGAAPFRLHVFEDM